MTPHEWRFDSFTIEFFRRWHCSVSSIYIYIYLYRYIYRCIFFRRLTRHLNSTAGLKDDFYLSWRSPHVMEEASPASQHLIYGAQANPSSTLQRHAVPTYLFLDTTPKSKYPDHPDKPTTYGTAGTTTVEMIYAGPTTNILKSKKRLSIDLSIYLSIYIYICVCVARSIYIYKWVAT
jgi:hypothetical protein